MNLVLSIISFWIGFFISKIYFKNLRIRKSKELKLINELQLKKFRVLDQKKQDDNLFKHFVKNKLDYYFSKLSEEFELTINHINKNINKWKDIEDENLIDKYKKDFNSYIKICNLVNLNERLTLKEFCYFSENIEHCKSNQQLDDFIKPKLYIITDPKTARYLEPSNLEVDFKNKYF